MEISQQETEDRSLQLKETMEKLQTVRGTLQDATEVNSYKAKELKDKVSRPLTVKMHENCCIYS